MEKLTYPEPIHDPSSGYLLQMSLEEFSLDSNLEMSQTVRLTFYTNDNGSFGIPLSEYISIDPNLSKDQKNRLLSQYKSFTRTSSTHGYKVDPLTQETVYPDELGNYPENSIDEKLLWMGLKSSDVPGDTVAQKVLAMLVESMGKMVQRKRI